jgi:hypothetical protein
MELVTTALKCLLVFFRWHLALNRKGGGTSRKHAVNDPAFVQSQHVNGCLS